MADQAIEQYMYATSQVEPVPGPNESTLPVVSLHDQYDEQRRRKHTQGPQTPSGSDTETEKRSRRRSPRRRRRSSDSYRSRSRSLERRRYFEEYRQRRRFESDSYRHWNYGYVSDWRPRGRRFSWWRGSARGYGGPRYGQSRSGWYGAFDRKPSRFYQPRFSERYPPRRYEYDNYEYARERGHRRRLEYDEGRRSRRSHERERPRREVRTNEDTRSHVTSSRTVPADEYADMQRPESTYVNNNYTEICT